MIISARIKGIISAMVRYLIWILLGKDNTSISQISQCIKHPIIHHFVTEICAHFCCKIVHCGVWNWSTLRYGTSALWDLWDGSIVMKIIDIVNIWNNHYWYTNWCTKDRNFQLCFPSFWYGCPKITILLFIKQLILTDDKLCNNVISFSIEELEYYCKIIVCILSAVLCVNYTFCYEIMQ